MALQAARPWCAARLMRAAWLGCAAWITAASVQAQAPPPLQVPEFSVQALRRLQGGATADPSRVMADRERLLNEGEAHLAAGEVDAAQQAFDAAALLLHAADTEVALVRTYMQAGEYRRALAFGAHAAGAHRELPAATALYAWLLHLGGQTQVAQHTLGEATKRSPDDTSLQWVLQRTRSSAAGDSVANAAADAAADAAANAASNAASDATAGAAADAATQPATQPPADVAIGPYAVQARVPQGAAVVGSAVLAWDGAHALVPSALLPPVNPTLWLRNGLGHTVAAKLMQRDLAPGVSLLRLLAPLPVPHKPTAATRAPFAGSPAAMVEFDTSTSPNPSAAAAWPQLRLGFFARPSGADGLPPLGISAPPGPRGGPVFDMAGRLVGMAVADEFGQDRMRAVEPLFAAAGIAASSAVAAPTGQASAAPMPVKTLAPDQVYELSLRLALQVLVLR
jgi:hypothetical protein